MHEASRSRWPRLGGIDAHSSRGPARWRRIPPRARCSALLAAGTDRESAQAVSAALIPSTSLSTSDACWRGGRCRIEASSAGVAHHGIVLAGHGAGAELAVAALRRTGVEVTLADLPAAVR